MSRPADRTHDHALELEFARAVLRAESDAIRGVADRLGAGFATAVDLIDRTAESGGTVLVTGLGKSGHIGSKIAATLASLGIPAHYVHPAEAAHGDLGRFRPSDTCLALSFSGETAEVVQLAAILRQDGIPVVAITGGAGSGPSSLQRLASVHLALGFSGEAGHDQFPAPTSSTTATLALGDALALASARRRNFTASDFARRHPGGSLGGMLRPVVEMLRFRCGKNLPAIADGVSVREALEQADRVGRRPGAIVLVDDRTGALTGIFTDGDFRRLVLRDPAAVSRPIREVMTRAPRVLSDTALARDAARMIQEFRQDEIPVVSAEGLPIGILDVQDLIALKLVED